MVDSVENNAGQTYDGDATRSRGRGGGLPLSSVLAVDVGGTKLAAAVVDGEGALLADARVSTPATSDGEELFRALEQLCRDVLRAAGTPVAAIGVGCGGPMRYPEGVVSPLNIPAWHAAPFPLRQRLAAAFDLPCDVDNDAKAMAHG